MMIRTINKEAILIHSKIIIKHILKTKRLLNKPWFKEESKMQR